MMILSLDPGSKESAWMLYDGTPREWAKEPNAQLLERVRSWPDANPEHLAIESMVSYGQMVGEEVFTTCVWIGRFIEAWGENTYTMLRRADIKRHVCGTDKAKDSGVREALITRWGGEGLAIGGAKCRPCFGKGMIGGKKKGHPCATCQATGLATPRGKLHGITADCWSALAIAVCWSDTKGDFRRPGDAPDCAKCKTITVRAGNVFKCLNCGEATP